MKKWWNPGSKMANFNLMIVSKSQILLILMDRVKTTMKPKGGTPKILWKSIFEMELPLFKLVARALKPWHSSSTFSRAFQNCQNHQNPTTIARLANPPKIPEARPVVRTTRSYATRSGHHGKTDILAIFNSARCAMQAQNDPANNPKWNPKEKHQFFLAKSARLGSKNCHQKYILTIEQAESIFEKYCLLLTTLLV